MSRNQIPWRRARGFVVSVFMFCSLLALLPMPSGAQKQSVRIWLIPAENAGPNDIAQGERIPEQLDALRRSLEGTGVRLLNVEDPLAMKARIWNPQFSVPNFQMVATQVRTLAALKRFAREHNAEVVLRLVTWDEAFGLLSAGQTEGPDALPDVAQIGSTWAGYFAGRRGIASRPNWSRQRGNWVDVLRIPASALPYANDVRLLFYWKRLPSAAPDSPPLVLNGSSWQAVMESLRDGTSQGDTIVFPTGVTLNLLHDYFPLVSAGTGKSLLSTGPLGTSIDLTGPGAFSVPNYLASQVHLPQPNGESRRLISFPEASHQEASRTFVNGGYRATIEPASFVNQWFHDFEERQDSSRNHGQGRRHFWDYAGVLAPPANFKGGSELVILRNAKDPELTAKLAEFLATDDDYTKVLAEAGQLPALRPGFGIHELTESFEADGDPGGAAAFSSAVQTALNQGIKYPDLENWPGVFENHEVLETLQRVWRRMAEGDGKGMARAARDLQVQISSQIYWPTKVGDLLARTWPFTVPLLVLLTALVVWVRARSLHRLSTALHLYRASRHESGKILGDNIAGLHELARTGKLNHDQLMQKLKELADHYTEPETGLVAYMVSLGEDLVSQVQGAPGAASLDRVAMRAFHGAQLFFRAKNNMCAPTASLVCGDLTGWKVPRNDAIATVILQEWFYNCIKSSAVSTMTTVSIEARRGTVLIHSTGRLTEQQAGIVTSSPSRGVIPANASGLYIIRDLTYYAFSSRVSVRHSDNQIHITIPLHMRRTKSQ